MAPRSIKARNDADPDWIGALVSEARSLVFATNRGENTVSVFTPGNEPNSFKMRNA
jgi:hypothetical protein